jgi:P-loop Domain of unknown function (DUF2791)
MNSVEAERVIESLRFGIPPQGQVLNFTVGRRAEITQLTQRLHPEFATTKKRDRSLLVSANWGSGKSHLLQVIREVGLKNGFAVSLIVADAQGGVRFNRMDTIFGAVCREIEIPHGCGKGVGELFNAYSTVKSSNLNSEARLLRSELSNEGKWDYSETLKSAAMFVALRAWLSASSPAVGDTRARITDWLVNPMTYRSRRKDLYNELIDRQRNHFRDPRPEFKFYADDVFTFHVGGHRQSWDGLADLDLLAQLAGFRGLVLLVDEFEDVIQNLTRVNFKQAAFWNLFHLFRGDHFTGQSYFAVTPEFVHKCKQALMDKGVYDYDFSQFDKLPRFQMDPIDAGQMVELATHIRDTHATAYTWNARSGIADKELASFCEKLAGSQAPDRIRQAIVGIVRLLDERSQR